MSTAVLARTTFETPRAAEYFSVRELQAQTGQPARAFASVLLKELADNALDAAEARGVRPILAIEATVDGEVIRLRVRDNGAGIPPAVVRRILDFSTRTSDKAHYRAPIRGAQGNALKTVLGIPFALGSCEPVVIEACGVRHRIRAWTDPAGELRLEHDEEVCGRRRGTAVVVVLPAAGQDFDPADWACAYALVNPHAKVRIRYCETGDDRAESDGEEVVDSYEPVAPAGWAKWRPSDPTAPAWYDEAALKKLVFAHIADARRGGPDPTLREFVRQFRGLAGSAKVKAVTGRLPRIHRLSDFERYPDDVGGLLVAMQAEARAPAPSSLGLVGEEVLRDRLGWFGVRRHWYRKVAGEESGVPFAFEVLVAETVECGYLYHAVNHSPTFEDPLTQNRLECHDFVAHTTRDFLRSAHASPFPELGVHGGPRITAVVHLISPALEFLDRGKTRVRLPERVADAIGDTLWRAVAELYREGERRKRDAARAERRENERWRSNRTAGTLKDAVFGVLAAAVDHATGGGSLPVSARTLYYAVRKLIQAHTERDLDYDYFAQTLVPAYQEIHGAIANLYYDPRGVLYEPHTGREVALGTREVEDYRFPEFVYDKILYIEKKGLWPVLKQARVGERYDMAVIAAEGFANVAARKIFAHADRDRDYRLFVLHDADPAGYEIARTLRMSTRRMPDYRVEVTDCGLTIEDALALGLEAEEFTRRKELPQTLRCTDVALDYFRGRAEGRKTWIARRVELNAFTGPALIGYIERQLEAAGATTKVIPPAARLAVEARAERGRIVFRLVNEAIDRVIDRGALVARIEGALRVAEPSPDEVRAHIEDQFGRDRSLAWRAVLEEHIAGAVREQLTSEALDAAVREALDEG